jgi:Zinc carboxypeptidase
MRLTHAGFLIALAVPLSPLASQDADTPARKVSWHTVKGERHGVSFFPQHRFPEAEYEAGDSLTFDRYHSADVMYGWLERWARQYDSLVDVYEVGQSFEGRPILQVSITNKATGRPEDKPAAFFEGGRHSGEITGSESVLWLMRHVLTSYGRDPEITRLLNTSALYLRPQNNPDGSNLYLNTAQSNRSSVRPMDNDRDGLLDEDAADDLDGDGVIYQIRYRPENPDQANRVLDERDPSGRLLRPTRPGERGVWRVIDEGVDNDGDGRFNEDGIGGLDLHRNYPENWRPMPGRDATGRGYTQGGAGEFPLSEPETRATVMFLLTHPNVSVANSMDTRVPMHLRPPSTSFSADRMFPEDLAWYERFDSIGMHLTGYPWAGDVYDTYQTRTPVNPFTGDSARPGPLFGHGPDFGYFYYGAIWYGDELWNGGRMRDVNGDGLLDDVDGLAWDDADNAGRGFREWEPFTHPTLGPVEIGGFHPKFFSQNGPTHQLERWARNQALFNLQLALHLPRLDGARVAPRRITSSGDSTDYEVTVSWTNAGRLPTALRQAQLVKIVQEDRVRLQFDSTLTRPFEPVVRIVEPARQDKEIGAGWTQPGERKTVSFVVRTYGVPGVRGKVRVLSTRGGMVELPLTLGNPPD